MIITICFMWTLDKWLWLLTLAGWWRYWSLMYWAHESSESKQLASCIFGCCTALVPSLPLLACFAVQILLTMLLCWLGSIERSFWEYSCPWHLPRTLRKCLDSWSCGNYWCFLTSLCCLHSPTAFLWVCAQSDNIRCKAALLPGLKYFLVFRLALTDQPIGLN